MEKKFNFVYVTTNLINGKQYIGDHSTNNLEKDKYYIGSGNILYEAKSKYGKLNFKREILEFFSTKQEAFTAQEKYIKEYNTLTPNGYNISPMGGMNIKGCCSEETSKKISKALKGKDTWMKGKHHTEESKEKLRRPKSEVHKKHLSEALRGRSCPMKGKHHTEKSKQNMKIGAQTRDNSPYRTDEFRKKQRENVLGKRNGMYGISVYNNWVITLGKEKADEKAQKRSLKISKSLKGKQRTEEQKKNYEKGAMKRIKRLCPYCKREIDPGNYTKYHGENCKSK